MKIYKCDGEIYSNSKCCEKEEYDEVGGSPEKWLTIKVDFISNQLPNARLLKAGEKSLHFCSRQCLENYLFMDEKEVFNG